MSTALVKAKENAPREAKRTSDTTFDRIFKFYYSKKKIKLSPKEEEIRDRWYHAWQLLTSAYSRVQVANSLSKEYNISQRQGFIDVDNCQKLFSDPKEDNKLAKRSIAEHWIVKGINMALKDNDLLSYERLIRRYNRIHGLELPENEMGDWLKKQKPVAVLITADPSELEKMAVDLMKGIPDVHDISHEEVEDDED